MDSDARGMSGGIASGWLSNWLRHNARRRFGWIREHLVGETLLDVGAAEGWIGEAAAQELGLRVQLVDVVHMNRTQLPIVVYDGKCLPFPDNSWDTVTLLLTLHHCASPAPVLAEAARVAQCRVVVTESVFHTRAGRLLLQCMDGGLNGLRTSGTMAPALHFKTVREWRAIFREQGLRILEESWVTRGLHWQRLFVLEVEGLVSGKAPGRPFPVP